MSDKPDGQNVFREVIVKCSKCGGKKTTNMQCDIGYYDWECELCDEITPHRVTEALPRI